MRSTRSSWGWVTCFGSRAPTLYSEYATLHLYYQQWTPDVFKAMTPRERSYWIKLGEWLTERRKAGR